MALTLKTIARLSEPGRYLDEHNLLLQVARGGSKSWIFRYERDGRERMMGLGPLHTVSLAEARDAALAHRKLLQAGIDPLDAKAAEADWLLEGP
jgi:hypothetical protein